MAHWCLYGQNIVVHYRSNRDFSGFHQNVQIFGNNCFLGGTFEEELKTWTCKSRDEDEF